MYGLIPPITFSPPPPPRDLQFFSYLAVYPPPWGTHKDTIPHPRDSPSVSHCTHTERRNNAAFCVKNQGNNIYLCVSGGGE